MLCCDIINSMNTVLTQFLFSVFMVLPCAESFNIRTSHTIIVHRTQNQKGMFYFGWVGFIGSIRFFDSYTWRGGKKSYHQFWFSMWTKNTTKITLLDNHLEATSSFTQYSTVTLKPLFNTVFQCKWGNTFFGHVYEIYNYKVSVGRCLLTRLMKYLGTFTLRQIRWIHFNHNTICRR